MDKDSTRPVPEQLVNAEGLLKLLWDDSSRPSLRWLRKQQRRRAIPYIKIGTRVWFNPAKVKVHLDAKWTCKVP
jgi:hypothetical protein